MKDVQQPPSTKLLYGYLGLSKKRKTKLKITHKYKTTKPCIQRQLRSFTSDIERDSSHIPLKKIFLPLARAYIQ